MSSQWTPVVFNCSKCGRKIKYNPEYVEDHRRYHRYQNPNFKLDMEYETGNDKELE